jgi:hypothetical protein
MKPHSKSIRDHLNDHEVYHRSLVLFPYAKLPNISEPPSNTDDFSNLNSDGYKPLVGDTSCRSFLKAKVLRNRWKASSAKTSQKSRKLDHRMDSQFSESQKIRFLTSVKSRGADANNRAKVKVAESVYKPNPSSLQIVDNDLRRTYGKQAQLKELVKK